MLPNARAQALTKDARRSRAAVGNRLQPVVETVEKVKTLYFQKLSKLFLGAKILILIVIFSIIILFRQSR